MFLTTLSGLSAYFSSSNGLSGNETDDKNKDEVLLASPVLGQEMVNMDDVAFGASHFADSVTTEAKSSKSTGAGDNVNSSLGGYNLNMNVADVEPVQDSPDFEQFFQEGYCKAADECHESTEVANDVDCSSPCGREKSEEEDDNNDMLGCVFDFSEEGMNLKQFCEVFHGDLAQ